jgi:hypothetical protein
MKAIEIASQEILTGLSNAAPTYRPETYDVTSLLQLLKPGQVFAIHTVSLISLILVLPHLELSSHAPVVPSDAQFVHPLFSTQKNLAHNSKLMLKTYLLLQLAATAVSSQHNTFNSCLTQKT